MSRFIPTGLGWQPSIADPRDYMLDHPAARDLLAKSNREEAKLPKSVDLREFFPDVEDQGPLNSSCAFAVLGLLEYFETRSGEAPAEASRLFLYQMALRLRGATDDIGTDLRTTFKALRRFGAPPRQFWPDDPARFHERPTDPVLFAFARDYEHLTYVRLEKEAEPGVRGQGSDATSAGEGAGTRRETLRTLKSLLAAEIPFVLGFPVPATLTRDGLLCNGRRASRPRGGQAAIAVGYDDTIRIASHKGAFLIRNSWGSQWGDEGNGWLPYAESQFAPETWAKITERQPD